MIGLAHKLKGPMVSQSMHYKKYFAEVLVPTANIVREAGTVLDEQVDITFGEGIIAFDDACKMMERMLMQDDDALVTAYRNSQVRPTLSFVCGYDFGHDDYRIDKYQGPVRRTQGIIFAP